MRYLLPVCAGLALFAGTVSVSMWRELRTERQVSAGLRTERDEARATSARLSMALSERNVAALPAPAATVAATGTKTDSPAPTKPAAPNNNALSVQSILSQLSQEKDMLKDPEYRKARLAQARMSIARSYPGLAEELGLTDKEADQLFDLMAENQLNMSGEINILSASTSNDPAAAQETMRRQQAMQREQEDSIRSLLGNGKYAQYQDYQQTRPARTRVTSMGSTLAQAGQPLTAAQSKTLTTALIAEQQRQRQEQQTMARNPGNPADPDYRSRMLEESLKRNEDNNRRMLEAAAPTLNTRQLAALREQFELDAAMQRSSMRLTIERQRLQPTAPAGAATIIVTQAPAPAP